MPKDYYLPDADPELDEWADNYDTKLPTVAGSVGVSPGTLGDVSAAVSTFKDSLNILNNKKAEQKAATEDKNAAKKALRDLVIPLNSDIKTDSGYTPAIGDTLGIIGTDDAFDPDAHQPELTAEAFPGHVKLEFTKDPTDGVNLYTRLQGQPTWTYLARDTNSPYIDNRPLATPGQPEQREYHARGVINDEEIGQMSEIASVSFGG